MQFRISRCSSEAVASGEGVLFRTRALFDRSSFNEAESFFLEAQK